LNICKLFSKKWEYKTEEIFDDIIDYNNVKRLFIIDFENLKEDAGFKNLIMSWHTSPSPFTNSSISGEFQ
jgi:hypothetical protein